MLTAIHTSELTDVDHARFAFLRASNMLWALGDPARAKEIIDEASRITSPQARSYIDAFLAVYWFATDHPDAAFQASKKLALEDLPAVVGAEIAWVVAAISADAGRANRSRGRRGRGIYRCCTLFRCCAHEVQHRRRARERTAAGWPDFGCP